MQFGSSATLPEAATVLQALLGRMPGSAALHGTCDISQEEQEMGCQEGAASRHMACSFFAGARHAPHE